MNPLPPPKPGSTLSLWLQEMDDLEERVLKPYRKAWSEWCYGVAQQVIEAAEKGPTSARNPDE